MTVLLGRVLNGACWGVVVRLGGSVPVPASPAVQTAILVATL